MDTKQPMKNEAFEIRYDKSKESRDASEDVHSHLNAISSAITCLLVVEESMSVPDLFERTKMRLNVIMNGLRFGKEAFLLHKDGPEPLALAAEDLRSFRISHQEARLNQESEQALELFNSIAGIVNDRIIEIQKVWVNDEKISVYGKKEISDRLRPIFAAMSRLSGVISGSRPFTVRFAFDDETVDGEPVPEIGEYLIRISMNREAISVPDRFMETVVDLLANARKYSDSGSTIRLVIEDGSDSLKIAVIDEGMGFSEDDASYMGIAGWRSKEAKARTPRGHGLGLFKASKIVGEWNGTLSVRRNAGRGSTFEIIVPKPLRKREA